MTDSQNQQLTDAIGGDRESLTALLKLHGPYVRQSLKGGIAARWQSLLSIDDVLQQTYTDVFLDIGSFAPQGENSFRHWLCTLAKRNLLDAVKVLKAEKRGGNHRRINANVGDDSMTSLYNVLSASGNTPSRDVAMDEACGIMGRAINKLPTAYRKVIQLYDLDRRPVEEVAKSLDRSVGAVYLLRMRAHVCLQKRMGSVSQFLTNKW